MSHELMQRELVIDLETGDFEIRPVEHDECIIGPVDYGWLRFSQAAESSRQPDPEILTWGGGPLAGSRIPGTRRLVFCGYSPQWQGFYISSFGGGAYVMHRVGVDFITIKGAAAQDSVLLLNHNHGEIEVRLEPINPDVIWNGYADPDGAPLLGYYALQQAVFDRYGGEYDDDWVRVFAVGPASRHTNQGIIGSNPIKQRRITPIDDWAGRGGLGSRLLQTHRIAACIFGGDWEDPDLKDSKEINGYFQQYYGLSMMKTDLGATEKYRYVKGFNTGGTFGANMHTVDDKLFSFNYTSVYASDEQRLAQHDHFILAHYLRQFNEEIIEPKHFAHCGEPCGVVCKKYDREFKKDYEPYQALGPLCGIFDQRAAEKLNHYVDALGWDAIQAGGTVSWVMELIHRGMLEPGDYGLPPASDLSFAFASDPVQFAVKTDSAQNAAYAHEIIDLIIFRPEGALFRQGIRTAAKVLDERAGYAEAGSRCIDRAVFLSHGVGGCMTPNQYWVPGMFAPMPMMGKYFTYYGVDFLPPDELGRRSVQRMVYEFFSENSGVCRFHRKWVEAIVDEIIEAHYELDVDYKAHQFKLASQIFALEGDAAVFWENERTIDLIWAYLEKWVDHGLEEPTLHEWAVRFRADKWTAARAYWDAYRQGIADAFADGPDQIPEIVAPYQAARADVMETQER